MDYRKMYAANTLHDYDLMDESGRAHDRTFVIESCAQGELTSGGNKKDKLPIIKFEGEPKKFGVNRTNGKTIAGMYGKDTRDWRGKSVTLYATTTKFGPDTVGCLRVRPTIPVAPAGKVKPAPESVTLSPAALDIVARLEAAQSISELDATIEDVRPAVGALPDRERRAMKSTAETKRAAILSGADDAR